MAKTVSDRFEWQYQAEPWRQRTHRMIDLVLTAAYKQ